MTQIYRHKSKAMFFDVAKLFKHSKNLFIGLFCILLFISIGQNSFAQCPTAAPTLSATTQPLLCPLNSADLTSLVTSTAPVGSVLEWHSVSSNPSVANLVTMPTTVAATLYAYYYDNTNACYSSASAAVTVTNTAIAAPVATVTNNTLCVGGNGVITCTSPTPLANYEFAIDGGDTYQSSPTFTGLKAGTYNVIARLITTGCESPVTIKTIVDAPAVVTAPTATVANVTNCIVPNGAITVTAPTPLANYEFSIDGVNFQADPLFDALAGGTYNVVSKSVTTGCLSVATVKTLTTPTITVPVSTLVNPTSCINGDGKITFTGPLPLANYQFSIDGGATYQTGAAFTGLSDGSYDTRVKLISSGCESAIVAKTLINPVPVLAAANSVVVNNTSCNTSIGTLTFTGPLPLTNYQFSIDGGDTYQSSALFDSLSAGSYDTRVKLISSGCESAVFAKAITDAPLAVTAPTISPSAIETFNPTSCITPNGQITLTGPTPLTNYQFSIDGGVTFQTNAVFSNLAAGSYSVMSKLISTGCKSAAVAKVLTNPVVTLPTIASTNNTNCLAPNGTISITGTTAPTYEFSIDDGATYQASASFIGLDVGAYGVMVKLVSSGCESVSTVRTITDAHVVPASPTVTIGVVSNCITPNGSLTITAPVSLVNYTFSIDGGTTYQASPSFTGLDVGSYDVIAKSVATGCESLVATKVITSTVIAAPLATVVNNTVCGNPNGSITVTAVAGVTYSIDGGATFQASNIFSGLAAGSYDVLTKSFTTGCLSAITTKAIADVIPAVTSPTATAVNPTICSPANGTITFVTPTPLTNYTFSIDGGLTYQASPSFLGLGADTYNIRVKSTTTGCESPSVAKILTAPVVTLPVATSINNTSCGITPNGTITFTAPTPLANYTFSIDGGTIFQVSPSFTGLVGGTYNMVVKNAAGCTSAKVAKIITNSPVAIAAPVATTVNVTNCTTPNGSITFASPTPLANYEFSIDGGTTYQSSPIFLGLSGGTFSLKARSVTLYCVSPATAKTLTSPVVTTPVASSVNPTNCTTPNGTITVTAPTGSYQYSIDGGATFQAIASFTGLAAGTYSVIAKSNTNGCLSTALAKVLTNPVITIPVATVVNNSTCLTPNGSINVTSPTPLTNYLFSIDNGVNFQTTPLFPALATGTYNVMVQLISSGCKSVAVAKIVTNAPPVVTAPVATQVNNTNCVTANGSITFTGPTPLANYKFSIDGGVTFQTSNVFTGLNGGTYSTMVKSNATGCKSAAVAKILTNPTVTVPTTTIVNNTSCLSPNGKLTVTAPTPLSVYEFSKDGGATFQTSPVFTGLAAGTYNLVSRVVATGCKSLSSPKIVANPTVLAPISVATNNTDCNSPNGKLIFSYPTPLTNYVFSIDSGATYQSGINFTGLTGKTYYTRAKLVSSGCASAVVAKPITNPAILAPTVTVVNNTDCDSPNGKLTITAPVPLANYSFSIDSAATFVSSNVFSNLASGMYDVFVKLNSTGCKSLISTKTIANPVIASPVAKAFNIVNVCPSLSANLVDLQPIAAPNTMLEWHTGAKPTSANLVANPASVMVGQNYYLFAKSNVSSCYSAATTPVGMIVNDCSDTDGDGIADYLDVDDDNDGVLDLDEAIACSPNFWSYANFKFSTNKYSGDLLKDGVKVADVSFEIPAGQANYVVQTIGASQTTTRATFVTTQSIAGGDHYFQVKISPLPGQTIKSPFRIIAPGYAPTWVNHPGQHYAVLGNKLNGPPMTATFTEVYEHVNEVNGISTYYSGERLTNPAFAPDGAGVYDILIEADYAHPYIFEYHQVDIYGNTFINERVNIDVPQCYYNAHADWDGDGKLNSKDLDSDNDGCSDALEAGITTSKNANYQFAGVVGANGYMNYLETSLDNGIHIITPTYADAIDSTVFGCCKAGNKAPVIVKTSISNSCPATTVSLANLINNGTVPQGSTLIWSKHQTPTSAGDTLAVLTGITTAGTYYAMYYDKASNCYSMADSVKVNFVTCCTVGTNPPIISQVALNNICPAVNVSLATTINTGIKPAGSTLIWSVNNGPSALSDTITNLANITASGTYYAFYFNKTASCYSPADSINVSISSCVTCTSANPILVPRKFRKNLPAYCLQGKFKYYKQLATDVDNNIAIADNGNAFSPVSITVDATEDLAHTVTSGGKTTALATRMAIVKAPGSYTVNGGMKVRIYYDSTEFANLPTNSRTWFKHPSHDKASVLADLTATGLKNATKLTPDSTGVENGVAFVQFNHINNFSTFGFLGSSTGGTCLAGSTAPAITASTITNTCPTTTVDLTTLANTGTKPAGTSLVWSTHNALISASDTLSNITTVSAAGKYYSLYYDKVNGCYSPADSVDVSLATCSGTGTIICNSTQIIPAPVVGTASNQAIFVTINVTTPGKFSPVSINGSGFTLLTSPYFLTTSNIGLETFVIPVSYDGSTLTNNLQFTVGNAGTCTADMTQPSSKILKYIYNLDGCIQIIPGTLTK